MRIAVLLPAIHRANRGAEVALEAVAAHIAENGRDDVTVFGSGPDRPDRKYAYVRAPLIPRERFESFPTFPPFRSDYIFEEATWTLACLPRYRPSNYDVTMTCSFPFVNWLTTRSPSVRHRPAHVFVTQNGDHPALSDEREYRTFRCDGLICTNPEYYERQRRRWRSTLISNGVDPVQFRPGPAQRRKLGLPENVPIVLIVSALIESKRVVDGLQAVAALPGVHLVVAGDGPQRSQLDEAASKLMPGRFQRVTMPPEEMPDLYRSVDAFLHPGLHESFGNVYIEAAASGLPVVAHDSIVTRWIFEDDAVLVDANDEHELTRGLRIALGSGRGEFRPDVQRVHERFAWPNIANQYREFMATVVHERHRT